MRAMVVEHPGRPLAARDLPVPEPGPDDVLVRVLACGVCRTDLHVADGDLAHPGRPVVPGHEIVGEVVRCGARVTRFRPGDLAGIAWLGWACGTCRFCASGRENLCEQARFTGWQRDGGYAEYAVADARFAFPLPTGTPTWRPRRSCARGSSGTAPGGWRATRRASGSTASARRATSSRRWRATRGRRCSRSHGPATTPRKRSRAALGAAWAGGSDALPPAPLDAALLFAPVGALVPAALRAVAPGRDGRLRGHPHERHPFVPYALLWGERVVRSVANLTRARRRGVPRAGAARARALRGDALSARGGERGARSAPGGADRGGGGDGDGQVTVREGDRDPERNRISRGRSS